MREFIDYPNEVPQITYDVTMGERYASLDFDILGYATFLKQSGIRADRLAHMAVRFCSIQEDEISNAALKEDEVWSGEYRTNRFPEMTDEPTSIINLFHEADRRSDSELNKTLIHETGHYVDDAKGRHSNRILKRRSLGVEMPRALGNIFFRTAFRIFGHSYEELDDFIDNEDSSFQPSPWRAKLATPFLNASEKFWDLQQKIFDSPRLARLHYKFSYAEFKANRFAKREELRASLDPFIRSKPKN